MKGDALPMYIIHGAVDAVERSWGDDILVGVFGLRPDHESYGLIFSRFAPRPSSPFLCAADPDAGIDREQVERACLIGVSRVE